MARQRKYLAEELSLVCVFRDVVQRRAMQALKGALRSNLPLEERLEDYGEFVSCLEQDGWSLSRFLQRALIESDNGYVMRVSKGEEIPDALKQNAMAELALFSELTSLDAKAVFADCDYEGILPAFENSRMDFAAMYEERLRKLHKLGFGIFAAARMFRVCDGEILPVESADDISLDTFIGYESERKRVLENTRAFLQGKPAANVLLCGDAGTGKSSTVKACANFFAQEGLRLIELRKDQLFSLSKVMGRIAEYPLKFIIFIDDLSFNKNDDCFSMLKAVLEGSASARAENAVIYATSNRRHIVKETFSDRADSDDVHHSDTVEELVSLSDRFGLTVYFSKPNKELYLKIVRELAKKKGVVCNPAQLDIKAEAFALAKGSRSPRAAEQFINSITV